MSTEMSTENRWFAWYSEKQFNQIKNAPPIEFEYNCDSYTNVYRNVMYVERKPYIYYYDMDDNIVQVTHVVSVIDGEEPKCGVNFDDMEFIGEVKKCFKTSKDPITI
jgi:hypothetical protein